MNGAPVSSRFEISAGRVIVLPVVVIVVVVVIIPIAVADSVGVLTALLDDGEVESDDDSDSSDYNTDGDRGDDNFTFRFVRRCISITFLFEVSVAPAWGKCPSSQVGIVGIILVWDGRITTRVTVRKGIQRIDGGRIVAIAERGRNVERGGERTSSAVCSMTEEPRSGESILNETIWVERRVLGVAGCGQGIVCVGPHVVEWWVILMPITSVDWVVRGVGL